MENALYRCAFLLYKISMSNPVDPAALANAPDAVREAIKVLRDEGVEEEWFEDAEEM